MFLRAHPFALRTPLLLAGAVALAAPLIYSFAPSPAPAPEPTAAPAAPLAHSEGETRSYAYYPEQLAALSSLNSFAPVADPGQPKTSPAPGPTAAPPARPRPTEARRTEPRPVARPNAPAAAPVAPEPERNEDWKILGLSVPKPGWPDTKNLREKAAGWGEAAASLPGKAMSGVTRLWRGPEADAAPAPAAPARAN
jgi:hypothetical protein